jgi:hypothetical protein
LRRFAAAPERPASSWKEARLSRRAAFSQADINRAMKAAAKVGYRVEIEGGVIRLLPAHGATALPSPDSDSGEAAWDKALGLQ